MRLTQLLVSRMVISCIYRYRHIDMYTGMYIHSKSVLKCSDTKIIFTSISESKANPSSIGHTSPTLSASENGI